MESRNVQNYRAGHEAFNQRDFAAMTGQYADSITWTDHSQGRTFTTPREFRDDFLAGWVQALPRHQNHRPPLPRRWRDGGVHLHRRRHARRAARTVPRHRQEFTLPLCEMWHFDSGGRVVGGDLYYDQVTLLTQLGLMPQPPGA